MADFDIVNFPALNGEVPSAASSGALSQLFLLARASGQVCKFNDQNKLLTAKQQKQRYRYRKMRKTSLGFKNRRYSELIRYITLAWKHFRRTVCRTPNFLAI